MQWRFSAADLIKETESVNSRHTLRYLVRGEKRVKRPMGFTAQHQEMIGRHYEVKAQRECEKRILKELISEKFPNSR